MPTAKQREYQRQNMANWWQRQKEERPDRVLARKEYMRQYRLQNIEKIRHANQLYRQRDPLKARARAYIQKRVRHGEVKRLPCVHCGAPESQAHHPDYAKPLDVVWLCRACHIAEHKAMGVGIGGRPRLAT